MNLSIVDTVISTINLLNYLENLPTDPPSLYLDLEGVRLSRHGSISIIQIFVLPLRHIFLIDIHILQNDAFCTPNLSGTTLKSVFESELVPKVFFDVRNDADALFAHFQIGMQGVRDIQLLEVATRSWSKDKVVGLAQCIERDAKLPAEAKKTWKATKDSGRALFGPEDSSSYEIFNIRPIRQEIVDYCANDVVHLPVLWNTYSIKLSKKWASRVQEETDRRVLTSQAISYDPHGRDKTLSPWVSTAKYGKPDHSRKSWKNSPKNAAKKHQSAPELGARQAAHKKAGKQSGAMLAHPSSGGETHLQRPTEKTDLKPIEETLDLSEISENLPVLTKFSITHKPVLAENARTSLDTTVHPAAISSKWTCPTCHLKMQESQGQDHLRGKNHAVRLKQVQNAMSESSPRASTSQQKSPRAGATTVESLRKARAKSKSKAQQNHPGNTKDKPMNSRKQASLGFTLQQAGTVYPPEWGFIGFDGSSSYQSIGYGGGSSLGAENYGLCDKDCGWCGHCMDGVDI